MPSNQPGKLTFGEGEQDEAVRYLRSVGASAPQVYVRLALHATDNLPTTIWPGNDPNDTGQCLGTLERNDHGGLDFIPVQDAG